MSEQLGGRFLLGGDLPVHRLGFGAMRLGGRMAFGPPADPAECIRVLQTAIEAGIDHIDTSDFYGPHLVNRMLRETLHPYRDGLVIVTKVGARRGERAAWHPAMSPAELRQGVEDNLRNLALDRLDVVNLRFGIGVAEPFAAPVAEQFEAMLELQREGKIRHIGLSNIVPSQLEEALALGPVACVQNGYSVLNRDDDELVETCAERGIAFVPFFPLGGGLKPLKATALNEIAAELGATPHQVALAWLLHGPENLLLIPGTAKVAHLRQNIAAAGLALSEDQIRRLDSL